MPQSKKPTPEELEESRVFLGRVMQARDKALRKAMDRRLRSLSPEKKDPSRPATVSAS